MGGFHGFTAVAELKHAEVASRPGRVNRRFHGFTAVAELKHFALLGLLPCVSTASPPWPN